MLEAGGGSVKEDARGNVWVGGPKNRLIYFDRAGKPHDMVWRGKLEKEVSATYKSVDEKQIGRLLFAEDPYLWKKGPEETKKILSN